MDGRAYRKSAERFVLRAKLDMHNRAETPDYITQVLHVNHQEHIPPAPGGGNFDNDGGIHNSLCPHSPIIKLIGSHQSRNRGRAVAINISGFKPWSIEVFKATARLSRPLIRTSYCWSAISSTTYPDAEQFQNGNASGNAVRTLLLEEIAPLD